MPIGKIITQRGNYRIDNITNNAVILIRNSINTEIALMNMGVADSVNARDLLSGMLKNYLVTAQIPPDNEYPKNISAVLIGGDYREHKETDDGQVVYIDHKLARRKAAEALSDLELRVTQVPTDNRAVKTVFVSEDGSFRVEERREGLNAEEAEMSKAKYEKMFNSQG